MAGTGGRAVVSWLLQQYPIDRNSARCIYEIFSQQIAYLGEDAVPTDRRIVVEECQDREAGRRDFYFHSGYGLRFNEGLARMLAYLLARQRAGGFASPPPTRALSSPCPRPAG